MRRAFLTELRAAGRAFIPHERNSLRSKLVLIFALSVWAVLEIATTLTSATPPESMTWIRYVAIAIFFRQYGKELKDVQELVSANDEDE